MRSIRYTNVILTLLAILLSLQLWTQWVGGPSIAAPAQAQGIPDEGAQRKQMIDELKLLNSKVEELKGLLVSGKARVTVTTPAKE